MKKQIKFLLIGLAAFGVPFFASAEEGEGAGQSDSPMISRCDGTGPGAVSGGRMQGPRGPMNAQVPGNGMRLQQGMPGMGAPDGMCDMQGMFPKEFRDRMETIRADRMKLRDLWREAVLSRKDKAIEEVRDEFQKTNADLIQKLADEQKTLREDMDALRDGYAAQPVQGRKGIQRMQCDFPDSDASGECFPGPEEVRTAIDTDIVAALNAADKPLTVEVYASIVSDALSRHKGSVRERMEDVHFDRFPSFPGMMPMGPMMSPELSRMRAEMGNSRVTPRSDRRELRARLREAMKIQDQAKREAAVKSILDDSDSSQDDDDAMPPCPPKQQGACQR